jgi:peptidoglycan/LPS O-acetylase OafA/YrhL
VNTHTITFTRFIAALLVVFFHFGLELEGVDGWMHSLAMNGNIAVSYFFFLSGFVLYKAYDQQILNGTFKLGSFWINRFSRIYPLYLFALLAFLTIANLTWGQEFFNSQTYLSLFLVQSWMDGQELSLNYPGWSLSNEMLFYFTFPFIIKLFSKFGTKLIIGFTLLLWVATQLITFTDAISQYHPLMHLSTFVFGIAFCKLMLQHHALFVWNPMKHLIFFCLTLSVLLLILANDSKLVQFAHNGLLSPIYAIIVVSLIHLPKQIKQLLSSKPLSYLGEISYAFYILQYPVLLLLQYFNRLSGWTLYETKETEFMLLIGLLLMISALAYHLIEMPAKSLMRKRFQFLT